MLSSSDLLAHYVVHELAVVSQVFVDFLANVVESLGHGFLVLDQLLLAVFERVDHVNLVLNEVLINTS